MAQWAAFTSQISVFFFFIWFSIVYFGQFSPSRKKLQEYLYSVFFCNKVHTLGFCYPKIVSMFRLRTLNIAHEKVLLFSYTFFFLLHLFKPLTYLYLFFFLLLCFFKWDEIHRLNIDKYYNQSLRFLRRSI